MPRRGLGGILAVAWKVTAGHTSVLWPLLGFGVIGAAAVTLQAVGVSVPALTPEPVERVALVPTPAPARDALADIVADSAIDAQLRAVDSLEPDAAGDARLKAPARAPRHEHVPILQPTFPLDLNGASAFELEAVPGIGPVLSERIV